MATVLLVDDSATNRALLRRILEDDYRIVEAANGAEALGLVRVERPDLVLTDVLMPKVDGYELERQLRADPLTAGLPVIFHTAAYTAREVLEVAVPSDRVAILPKPAEVAEVLDAVGRMLAAAQRDGAAASTSGDHHDHLALLNAKLLQKVRELELAGRERQKLLAHIIRAQEEERERIAADIHDDPVQAMTAVAMRLETLERWLQDPQAIERHAKLKDTVRHAIGRLRRLLFQLHPGVLDEEGLAAAVRAYLDHTLDDPNLRYEVDDSGLAQEPSPILQAVLYRIVQEALANVTKHADASCVQVTLSQTDDGYHVHVRDDGRGFVVDGSQSVERGHLGLTSMRQRAELVGGSWHVDSSPGSGTTVSAWIPYIDEQQEEAS